MERLFGRGKKDSKKSSTSTPNSQASPSALVTNEEEGFAVVSQPPLYPTVPQAPYPVLNPSVAPSVSNGEFRNQSSTQRQTSTVAAYLDGIPFTLHCSGNAGEVDEITARIERVAERIRNVDWASSEYDFRLERSVLNEDLNHSLQRLQIR